jgi:hypothetical protein
MTIQVANFMSIASPIQLLGTSMNYTFSFVCCSSSHLRLFIFSEKVNDHVMGKSLSAAALFQFIADKIVDMDLLGTGDGDDDDAGFAVVGMDEMGGDEIDPYAIKEGVNTLSDFGSFIVLVLVSVLYFGLVSNFVFVFWFSFSFGFVFSFSISFVFRFSLGFR